MSDNPLVANTAKDACDKCPEKDTDISALDRLREENRRLREALKAGGQDE